MANIGITLRSARIQRGLTIEQVAQDTRISARFLDALESEAFDELPAPVYVRGFLRSYATYLRLEPQDLLEQLEPGMGGGAPAGQGTNGGSVPSQPATRRADPFRPAPPMPAPPKPSRPRFTEDDQPVYGQPEAVIGGVDPFSARRVEPETPLDSGYEEPYRRGRVGGVLVERGAVYRDSGGGAARIVAIVGAALILLVVFAGITMALGGGGGDDDDPALGGGENTPGSSGTGTIVVGGTKTASATASPGASGTGSVTTTATAPGTTPAGVGTTPGSTVPGATPTAPATATQPPATPTRTQVPPTPTPTLPPPPSHGSLFQECQNLGNGQYNCGSPMTVVCPPGQVWFVDYGNDYPKDVYGWPSIVVSTLSQAINAGTNGCI